MALKSRSTILNEAASEEGASSEAILMAALNESQEEYKRLSGKLLLAFESYDKRIEALEAAVRASNTEKAQNYTEALKNASETILGDIQGKIGAYMQEVEAKTKELQAAKVAKEKESTLENITIMAIVFVVIVGAFYVALLLYGWWYDIPEAVGAVGKLDAINNGIYQLMNR